MRASNSLQDERYRENEQLMTKHKSLRIYINIDKSGDRDARVQSVSRESRDSLRIILRAVEKSEGDGSMAKSWAASPELDEFSNPFLLNQ